eukprot:PITA_34328
MEKNSSRSNSVDLQANETQCCSSRNNTKKIRKGRECCMCGDVGFQESLFRCQRCNNRFQHRYCSKLYSDQLESDGLNVCDWCLDLEEKEKNQRQNRNVELEEMDSRNAKELAATEASAMKEAALVTTEKLRKANAKTTHKIRVKFGGNKQPSSPTQDCELSGESCRNVPCTSSQINPSKRGLGRRYKLLSDVLY